MKQDKTTQTSFTIYIKKHYSVDTLCESRRLSLERDIIFENDAKKSSNTTKQPENKPRLFFFHQHNINSRKTSHENASEAITRRRRKSVKSHSFPRGENPGFFLDVFRNHCSAVSAAPPFSRMLYR